MEFDKGESGEIVGLLGPNGCRKTTSFYMIIGMIRANRGRYNLDNTDIIEEAHVYKTRMGIGYLPQEPPFFESSL
jgi:lipopolysaccharide export system ATP-binding protein